MTRNGKIARLPQSIREEINLRLQNGEEARLIAGWLNTLPKVQALLKAGFDGQPINENNLSNWKLGGFREWQDQQATQEAVHRLAASAAGLRRAASGDRLKQPAPGALITDQLALYLASRLAVALAELPSASQDPDGPEGHLKRLRLLCLPLVALRKGDHDVQWLLVERDRLALLDKKFKADLKKNGPDSKPRRLGGVPPEVMAQVEKDLRLL
jgi:hypothetical protein